MECNLAHQQSVAVLCMLIKIKSNPMHPLSSALPSLCVPAWITRGTLDAQRDLFAYPRSRTSQCHRTSVPLSVSLWNDCGDIVFA